MDGKRIHDGRDKPAITNANFAKEPTDLICYGQISIIANTFEPRIMHATVGLLACWACYSFSYSYSQVRYNGF